MDIMESLITVADSIKTWSKNKFVSTDNVDTKLNATSTNPVSNKAVSAEINSLNDKVGDIEAALDDLHTYAQEIVGGGTT
jgi:hypothetical protein